MKPTRDARGRFAPATTGPRIGSLFSGYGGLEMGVQQVLGGTTSWHVEFDAAPSKVLAHHWPGVPNHGDVTTVDWTAVDPIDVLTGGFPCQDVSLAGRRAGITAGTRSGLWSEFARAIDVLRPGLVVIENVRGLLSASAAGAMEPDPWGVGDGAARPTLNAFGAVLGDLAGLGYDAVWCGVRAADAGAPHGRFRVFIVAHPAGQPWRFGEGDDVSAGRGAVGRRAGAGRGALADTDRVDHQRREAQLPRASGLATGDDPRADDAAPATHSDHTAHNRERARAEPGRGGGATPDALGGKHERRGVDGVLARAAGSGEGDGGERERDGHAPRDSGADSAWGEFAPAVQRWESVTGRAAPAPTKPDGRNDGHRLSAEFVEWMMGLPAGHVTSPAIGLTRNEQLKALGNGVVPQQAALALHHLLSAS